MIGEDPTLLRQCARCGCEIPESQNDDLCPECREEEDKKS